MEAIGPFSNRMVRRHVASYTARLGLTPHFEVLSSGGTYNFRRRDFDRVTGMPIVRVVSCAAAAANGSVGGGGVSGGLDCGSKGIRQVVLRASSGNARGEVLKFAEFLGRCLALDPARRIGLN